MMTCEKFYGYDPKSGPPPLPEKDQRRRIHLTHCRSEWSGEFFLIIGPSKKGFGNCVLWREHKEFCYMAIAWQILTQRNVGAGWKNLDVLVTLRQAVREHSAQGMPLSLPPFGASRATVNEFLRQARAHDVVHHGCKTF